MTTTAPATDRPPRIQLDSLIGLRAIATCLVFATHASIALVFDPEASTTALRMLIGPGEASLAFFFMLSGFVLAWVARPGESRRLFWRRRVVKIFPNHVVTWTAGLVLMVAFGVFTSWAEVLPSLFLVQSWIPVASVLEGPNGPSWSLACELFMYALFPFILTWAMRLDARRLRGWLIGLTAGILLVTALVGIFVPDEPKALGQDLPAVQLYFLIFFPLTRLPEFAIGVLLGRLVITGQWRPVRARWTWLLLGAGWVLSLTLPMPLGFVAPFVPGIVLLVGGAATADLDGARTLLTRRWMVWLGDRSFAFYLVHGNVLIYSERAIGQGPYPAPYAALYVLGVLVVSLVLAHVLHTRVENPMMRRYARSKRKPEPAPQPAAEPAGQPAARTAAPVAQQQPASQQ